MNNDDKETLSQLMDGEWQDLDAAQSVKATCADKELQATWSRYHLIRDVMRNDAITVDSSLTSRISQAIDDEPSYSNVSAIGTAERAEMTPTPIHGKSSHLRTGLGGFALAACVALATVLGMNFWQGAPTADNSVQNVASVPSTIPATFATTFATTLPSGGFGVPGVVLSEVEYVSNKGTYWVMPEAKRSVGAEKRLNALMMAHIESSPTAERTGMLPYSRLVGYDTVAPEQ